MRFEPQIRPTRLQINFLLITATPERKVRLCETVWFFSWVNTHPFDLKFVAFCPEFSGDFYVEFQERTISEEFFNQTNVILYQNLWNFALYFAIFILCPFCAEKIHTSTLICFLAQVRRHVHKGITKRIYGVEKPGRFIFEKPVLFTLGLRLTTPYSLGVLVWNIYKSFLTVSIEFWLRFEPQIRPTRLAINFLWIPARAERKVRLCDFLIFFVGEYSSVWPEIYRVLSRIQWRLLSKISAKNYFGRIFQLKKVILYQNLWNFALLPAIFILSSFCLEKIHKLFSYVFGAQVRRHVHKGITKRIYGVEKPGHFVFEKQVLFTLGLGLTTPYSLGVLVWNFYQMFVTMSIEFWQIFEPQICPTRLVINFLLITARVKGRYVCGKLINFFRWWILIRLTWNLSRFVDNSVQILTWNLGKKLFRKNFSEIFTQTKAILYQNLWNFALLSAMFILRPYCAEKIHTSTFICFLRPGKEARP